MHVPVKGAMVAVAVLTATPAFAQFYDYNYGPGAPYGPGHTFPDYSPRYHYEQWGFQYLGPWNRPPLSDPPFEGRSVAVAPAAAPSAVAYCQRYHSYDPASGTYLGRDGMRHPCP